MSIIRVTKEFRFEMAHALWNYDGACRNVHGHSYILFVTFAGRPDNDPESPVNGMVIDFGDLKRIVNEAVVDKLDHSLLVSGQAPAEVLDRYRQSFANIIVFPVQPTCENLVADIAVTLSAKAPPGVWLHSLRLYETATAYAEWYASDNQ